MRLLKTLGAVCGVGLLMLCLTPTAHADEWNKKTYLTFSGPVQVPGATLPAGTYTFELADPNASRHIIRVSEKESGKHVGLFMTIPNERLDAPSDNLIMFSERPAGQPQAIQAWFYPGDRTGEEFVYPKAQALQIAKAAKKGVLATEGGGVTTASEESRIASLRGASIGRVDENGTMSNEDSKTATTAPAPTTPATTTARAERSPSVGTSGSTAAAPARNRRRALPRTASNLVALELLSVLALAGAFGVRQIRRRPSNVQ